AIFFSIAFPLIFILVFGFLGGGGSYSLSVAPALHTDTDNPLFQTLKNVPALRWKEAATQEDIDRLMKEGELVATIGVRENPQGAASRHTAFIHGASSQMDKLQQLQSILHSVIQSQDPEIM